MSSDDVDAAEPRAHRFYRHFKGGEYRVLGMATHTETGERMVIYEDAYEPVVGRRFWTRPLSRWNEPAPDGQPRFVEMPPESHAP